MGTPQRPNVLLIMSDEHAPQYSSVHGHPLVRTPQLDRLAAQSAIFDAAYCNSPLCLPSRMSFMTGRLGSRVGSFDNASPLASDEVTWAHRFRAAGYDVVLAGKMHFCGPDQLHGFRTNLSRDIHADLWQEEGEAFVPKGAADWSKKIEGLETVSLAGRDDNDPADKAKPQQTSGSFHILEQAGHGDTVELEVDEDVEAKSLAYLADPARHEAPWVLNASFIAPHFPLVSPQEFWAQYAPEDVDMPPPQPLQEQPAAIQRMRIAFGLVADPGEQLTRRARAGYYALISWFDTKVGAEWAT